MKVENGKIVEATEEEMFDYYLTREWDLVMSFSEYLRKCKENGTRIVKTKGSAS